MSDVTTSPRFAGFDKLLIVRLAGATYTLVPHPDRPGFRAYNLMTPQPPGEGD